MMGVCDEMQKRHFLLQGVGALISWNSILTSLDWFNYHFEEYNPGFWLPILYFIPSAMFQPLTVVYGNRFGFLNRIAPAYFTFFLILVLIPIIAETLSQSASFYIICLLIFILGAATSICQSSLVALSGMVSGQSVNSLLIGFGFSGLIISTIRLIFLASFPSTASGYLTSTMIYFFVSSILSVICITSIKHLLSSPQVSDRLIKVDSKQIFGVFQDIELQAYNQSQSAIPSKASFSSYLSLISQIWQYTLLIYLNYVITFAILCGVGLKARFAGLDNSDSVALMVFLFNLFDVIGRFTATSYTMKLRAVWVSVTFRTVFFFTFYKVAYSDKGDFLYKTFASNGFVVANMALYAFSNGYLTNVLMTQAAGNGDGSLKEKIGYCMSAGLMFGIISGQFLSYLLVR